MANFTESPVLGDRYTHALQFVAIAHRNQVRKDGTPYLAHLLSVSALVLEAGGMRRSPPCCMTTPKISPLCQKRGWRHYGNAGNSEKPRTPCQGFGHFDEEGKGDRPSGGCCSGGNSRLSSPQSSMTKSQNRHARSTSKALIAKNNLQRFSALQQRLTADVVASRPQRFSRDRESVGR